MDPTPRIDSVFQIQAKLLKTCLLAAILLPAADLQAQGLAPMVGASAIQGTLQGTSMPAYTGVLDRARNTVGTATSGQSAGGETAAAPATTKPGSNLASGAPSGASVNGQPIPLCSHGGLCQGAMLRAMDRP